MKTDNIVTGKLFTINQVIRIIISVSMAVFTLTMIYNRFLIMEKRINTLEDRIDKKDNRASSDRANLWEVIQHKEDKK